VGDAAGRARRAGGDQKEGRSEAEVTRRR